LLYIDVLPLLVAQDLYGRQHEIEQADAATLASAESQPILFENDLGSSDFAGHIGIRNLALLKWLKAISLATGERIGVRYEHERGDTPYEAAWWCSDPASSKGEVEVFGIQSNDGMDDPEWRREVIRFGNGQLERRAK
jgi:hypothetical protein